MVVALVLQVSSGCAYVHGNDWLGVAEQEFRLHRVSMDMGLNRFIARLEKAKTPHEIEQEEHYYTTCCFELITTVTLNGFDYVFRDNDLQLTLFYLNKDGGKLRHIRWTVAHVRLEEAHERLIAEGWEHRYTTFFDGEGESHKGRADYVTSYHERRMYYRAELRSRTFKRMKADYIVLDHNPFIDEHVLNVRMW